MLEMQQSPSREGPCLHGAHILMGETDDESINHKVRYWYIPLASGWCIGPAGAVAMAEFTHSL